MCIFRFIEESAEIQIFLHILRDKLTKFAAGQSAGVFKAEIEPWEFKSKKGVKVTYVF